MLIFTDHGDQCRVSFTNPSSTSVLWLFNAKDAREAAQAAEGMRDQLVEWAQRHERKPDPIAAAVEAAFAPDTEDARELTILSRVYDDPRAANKDEYARVLRQGIALGVYRAGKAVKP